MAAALSSYVEQGVDKVPELSRLVELGVVERVPHFGPPLSDIKADDPEPSLDPAEIQRRLRELAQAEMDTSREELELAFKALFERYSRNSARRGAFRKWLQTNYLEKLKGEGERIFKNKRGELVLQLVFDCYPGNSHIRHLSKLVQALVDLGARRDTCAVVATYGRGWNADYRVHLIPAASGKPDMTVIPWSTGTYASTYALPAGTGDTVTKRMGPA